MAKLTGLRITAKTPRGAASQLHKHILDICDYIGQSTQHVVLRSPEESERDCWEVIWEEGPFEWAVVATGGGDMYEEETQGTLYRNPPTFPDLSRSHNWFAEPGWSFSLGFYAA